MGYIDGIALAKTTEILKDYIDDKTSGGTPTTLAEIDAAVKSIFESTIVRNNDRYTSNTLTLYTPDADYQTYYIRKRDDADTYAVVWYKTNYSLFRHDNGSMGSSSRTLDSIYLSNVSSTYFVNRNNAPSFRGYPLLSDHVELYYSQNYNTLEDAIAAIQDSTTTYTYYSQLNGAVNNNPNYIGYSNASICFDYDGTNFVPKECPKLSDNEIIEVIQ